ncbi:hypothetical protein HDU88_000597 [Geranomyces variabilis]|nr:hypothetical protein HDU88_000597 [Geranomyces variabilis]
MSAAIGGVRATNALCSRCGPRPPAVHATNFAPLRFKVNARSYASRPRPQRQPAVQRQTAQPHPPPSTAQPPSAPTLFPPRRTLLLIVGAYFAAVNAGAAGLFWYDKHQAQTRGWRVPEKTLQLTALAGGWIGGMWAMKTFRHKTVKQSFQTPYMLCTGANVVICAAAIGASGLGMINFPKLLSQVSRNVLPRHNGRPRI